MTDKRKKGAIRILSSPWTGVAGSPSLTSILVSTPGFFGRAQSVETATVKAGSTSLTFVSSGTASDYGVVNFIEGGASQSNTDVMMQTTAAATPPMNVRTVGTPQPKRIASAESVHAIEKTAARFADTIRRLADS